MKMNSQAVAGSVRDRLLKIVQGQTKVFSKLSEAEQTAYIQQLEKDAAELVEDVIDEVTETGGLCSIGAMVKDVTVKDDEIKGTVTIPRGDENADLYVHAAHGPCKLAFAKNRSMLTSLGDTPAAAPDQPVMFKDDDLPKSAEVEETGPALTKRRGARTKAAEKGITVVEDDQLADLAGD